MEAFRCRAPGSSLDLPPLLIVIVPGSVQDQREWPPSGDSNLLFGRVLHVRRRNNGGKREKRPGPPTFEDHSRLSIFSLAEATSRLPPPPTTDGSYQEALHAPDNRSASRRPRDFAREVPFLRYRSDDKSTKWHRIHSLTTTSV